RLHQFPSKKPGSSASKKEKNYLFILERITLEEPSVSILFRQKKLSRREQQIVQYLLRGHGNKEIAAHLGLSENTIKGYLKLLMRKLGVGSRSGILALLLAKKPQ
ncbi:MAG: helix-turn-helix transcriptional regulator, partial [Nitrospirae bacterium]|nr:helix-turn-helix transcriptional regulator [Nitrospirota bacterium]